MTTLQQLVVDSKAVAGLVDAAALKAKKNSVNIGGVLDPIAVRLSDATNAIRSKSSTISAQIGILKAGLIRVAEAAADEGDTAAVETVNTAIDALDAIVGNNDGDGDESKDSSNDAADQSMASSSGAATAQSMSSASAPEPHGRAALLQARRAAATASRAQGAATALENAQRALQAAADAKAAADANVDATTQALAQIPGGGTARRRLRRR